MLADPISPLVENFTPSLVTEITTAEIQIKTFMRKACSYERKTRDLNLA